MACVEWSEKLSVGVEEIDLQHMKLIDMLNRLHDAMLVNRGRETVAEIVAEMLEYVTYHFATEELYMKASGYPDAEDHIQEHLDFAAETADFKDCIDRGDPVFSIVPLTLLQDWLKNHILGTDMKYSAFFRAHGFK